MAYAVKDTLIVEIPEGFSFGTDAFDAAISPPGGPPPPGSKIDIPDDWVDPPFVDDVRMLIELARGKATYWREQEDLREQVRGYLDLALAALYGAVDPAAVQPRMIGEVDELERRLSASLAATRELRSQLGDDRAGESRAD
jgi:hypothetical protein